MIVGRDHAGPGNDSAGKPFYGPYEAQELFGKHQDEIGLEMVDFKQMVYVQEKAQYEPRDEVEEGQTILDISGTELRRRLQEGLEIPDWFSFPAVVQELRKSKPPRANQGFTVFFTGLSGSGKSTIANALMTKLMEMGGRPTTLLDGDIVRKHLSSELGFSKEHRDINIQRIGFVASEITKNGGVAICAPIAPYERTRAIVREMVEAYGAFVEVHVATSPRGVRAARPQGALQAGAGREDQGVHRHLRPLRGAEDARAQARHREPRRRLLRPAGDPEAGEHGADPGLTRRGRNGSPPMQVGGDFFCSEG